MKTYVTNKLLSFGLVLACIFATYFCFDTQVAGWQAILLSVVIFGYSHFFIGFYYQWRSFLRKEKSWQHFLMFLVLALLSVGLALTLMHFFNLGAALFLGFVYFVLHGLFNEQTMVSRQVGVQVPLVFFLALLVSILGLVLYSLPDPTFFFNERLSFLPISQESAQFYFQSIYLSLDQLSAILWLSLAGSIFLLFYGWLKYGFTKLSIFFLLLILSLFGAVLAFGAPAYIYAYVLVVGYHFGTWFFYYISEMRNRGGQELGKFLIIHILFIVPLVYLATKFFLPYPPTYVLEIFNYNYFVVLTYIHITTSFMNDDWMKKIQAKIFGSV